MTLEVQNLVRSYDENYRHENYFRDRTWLYLPFIKALVKKAALRKGFSILDAGCGQGFFTSLFARLGLKATGVDLSVEGIKRATNKYGMCGCLLYTSPSPRDCS